MEVIVGPGFSIEVSVPDNYVIDRPPEKGSSESSRRKVSAAAAAAAEEGDCTGRPGDKIASGQMAEYSSDSSSSIGTPGDSEVDEAESDEDDVVSSDADHLRVRGLGSLSSLEDSLPIKRGLSNHYKGKSKSFGNLGEISNVKDVKEVEKQENPLNKRRRLQICSKWSRKSFYAWQNPKSMPLLPVNEDGDDDDDGGEEEDDDEDDGKSGFDETKSSLSSSSDDDDDGGGGGGGGVRQKLKLQGRKLKMKSFKNKNFKSQSCFALSDLQEEDDE